MTLFVGHPDVMVTIIGHQDLIVRVHKKMPRILHLRAGRYCPDEPPQRVEYLDPTWAIVTHHDVAIRQQSDTPGLKTSPLLTLKFPKKSTVGVEDLDTTVLQVGHHVISARLIHCNASGRVELAVAFPLGANGAEEFSPLVKYLNAMVIRVHDHNLVPGLVVNCHAGWAVKLADSFSMAAKLEQKSALLVKHLDAVILRIGHNDLVFQIACCAARVHELAIFASIGAEHGDWLVAKMFVIALINWRLDGFQLEGAPLNAPSFKQNSDLMITKLVQNERDGLNTSIEGAVDLQSSINLSQSICFAFPVWRRFFLP